MSDGRWEVVKACGVKVGICLAMLPVLYVLSTGPVIRWFNQQDRNGTLTPAQEERLVQFYEPLQIAYDNSPTPVTAAIDWYIEMWD